MRESIVNLRSPSSQQPQTARFSEGSIRDDDIFFQQVLGDEVNVAFVSTCHDALSEGEEQYTLQGSIYSLNPFEQTLTESIKLTPCKEP